MNRIQQLATLLIILGTSSSLATVPVETEKFFQGAKEYPGTVIDLTNPHAQVKYPELQQIPPTGQLLAFRVYVGTNMIREIKGTIRSSNQIDCVDGPEIRIKTGTLFDFFHALYMTDRLHQTPQMETPEGIKPLSPKTHIKILPEEYWPSEGNGSVPAERNE